jgi:hypothetical protein
LIKLDTALVHLGLVFLVFFLQLVVVGLEFMLQTIQLASPVESSPLEDWAEEL